MSNPRVVVLGAGFAGLELTTIVSEALGNRLDLTLIDRSDAFVFGYSKLDMIFRGATASAVRWPYARLRRPGVRFRQESVTAIDPSARRVTTDRGRYEADILVVALGAEYDLEATPGLAEVGQEFYSVAGAERVARDLARFPGGKVVVGVASAPYKCPPAPSEMVLLLHDLLESTHVRDRSEITLVLPLPAPVPPSPRASAVLIDAFAERRIRFVPGRGVAALDPTRREAVLTDGARLPFDLFLGVPHHRVPPVVEASGLTHEGWVTVDPASMATPFPGVYAVGDLADIEVPKAGVFAEGAARVAAASILADLEGTPRPAPYGGAASCYVEFGAGAVGRIDVRFPIGESPSGTFEMPSTSLAGEKREFGASRVRRWGLE